MYILQKLGFNSTCCFFFPKSRCFCPTKSKQTHNEGSFLRFVKFSDPIFNHGWWQELEAAGMDAGRFRSAVFFLPQGSPVVGGWKFQDFLINRGVSCFFWLFLYGKCLLQTFGTCSEKKHHRVVSQRCRAVDHLQLSPFRMSFVSVQPKGHQLFPPSN